MPNKETEAQPDTSEEIPGEGKSWSPEPGAATEVCPVVLINCLPYARHCGCKGE